MIKALVPFSGGLDSILVVKVLEAQGIKVTGLSFVSYFFDAVEAEASAKQLGIDLIIENISKQQLETVKNPEYGHGNALNPCIDCHGLMFKVAGKIAKEKGFDIIATGEVLGQRPFSQNREALVKVAKAAGLEGKILRPLSAKLLPPTIYEEKGIVDRSKLLDISGKSRKRQLELVEEYGVEYYPSPAGGCRLTEKEFGVKVSQLLKHGNNLDEVDFELLRIGRHYWVESSGESNRVHVVLGKNFEENKMLKNKVKKNDILVELEDVMGPIALVFEKEKMNLSENEELLNKIKRLVLDRTKSKDKNIEDVKWV